MVKSRVSFVCKNCGHETGQWYGKCPSCGEWNGLTETTRITGKASKTGSVTLDEAKPIALSAVTSIKSQRISTGFAEFDRVLGGGLVAGAVVLIAGDPGVGKSTLLLAAIGKMGGWYVTGEESAEQVRLRADRLGVNTKTITVVSTSNIEQVLNAITESSVKPAVLVVDSIQTMSVESSETGSGSVGQIRAVAQILIQFSKKNHIPIVIIGHITKEGDIAGPKLLEHMVDVVCYFEGERFYQGRMLRTLKNRFGPTDEVGVFEMVEQGLAEVANPSKLFLAERKEGVAGSAIAVSMEGSRPLLIEIQSLVVATQLPMPRRVASGIDYNRLQVLLAILQKRLNLPFYQFDVFVSVTGGLKIKEPAVDLPVALSLISAIKNKPLPNNLASFGELGLLGEIRRVQGEDRRIKEAKRLGFTVTLNQSASSSISQLSSQLFKP